MDFNIETWLQELGIKDYDDLTAVEKETYHKMLEIQQSAAITLDDFRSHVKTMRQSVESALAVEKMPKMRDIYLKARLKNYLLFEAFFERPERAKKLLDTYRNRAKK